MAKLRAIFTVLVILACVSISECRTEDIQCGIKCQLCDKVLKQAEIEPNKVYQITEITENVCNLKEAEPLEEQESEGQCNWEWKTIERTCQEVAQYLSLHKSTLTFVDYLCAACPFRQQVTKTSCDYLVNCQVPTQGKVFAFVAKTKDKIVKGKDKIVKGVDKIVEVIGRYRTKYTPFRALGH